jgi:hypothetical protein
LPVRWNDWERASGATLANEFAVGNSARAHDQDETGAWRTAEDGKRVAVCRAIRPALTGFAELVGVGGEVQATNSRHRETLSFIEAATARRGSRETK